MTLPFHISCSEPAVPLFRLADGRFQLTKDGPLAPFMDGPGYFLMEANLVRFIKGLDVPQITFEPVIVRHRRDDREVSTYSNLCVEQYFDSNCANELDLSGDRFYAFNDSYLFVSPSLKRKLESGHFTYLKFSEGWSRFAADEP